MKLECFVFTLLSIAVATSAWTVQDTSSGNRNDRAMKAQCDRRGFLSTALVGFSLVPLISLPEAAVAAPPSSSTEFLMFDKLSIEDAKKRFQLARKDLQYLRDNYGEISKGGGDSVRNYLGTQGISSNLFGIQKVLKKLQEESDDIVEYTETMDEFNAYYYQAEGAAYQSMFAEYSSASIAPASLLATAKKDIDNMSKYMDQLATQLNL